jgi:hypothetical protein
LGGGAGRPRGAGAAGSHLHGGTEDGGSDPSTTASRQVEHGDEQDAVWPSDHSHVRWAQLRGACGQRCPRHGVNAIVQWPPRQGPMASELAPRRRHQRSLLLRHCDSRADWSPRCRPKTTLAGMLNTNYPRVLSGNDIFCRQPIPIRNVDEMLRYASRPMALFTSPFRQGVLTFHAAHASRSW